MNFKTIILPKTSQTQRLYIEWFFFYEISKGTNYRDKQISGYLGLDMEVGIAKNGV